MKYIFKIVGALPGKDLIELEVSPNDTILALATIEDFFTLIKE
jgi:hypothetical protein